MKIPESTAKKAVEVCRHAIAYDKAIRSCANDPEKMSSFCTARGEDLDLMYWRWSMLAEEVLNELGQEITP